VLDPRAFLINSKTGRVVAATFVEFLSGNSTNPSICFTDSPDSGLQCDNTGAVNYVKNGINLGELGTASNLIGGSDTQIQFNDSGSFGGSADLTWDDTGKELGVGGDINLDGRFISSLNGAASEPAGTFTGTWFTGGTATTTKPQLLIEPTGTTSTAWSTSGTGLGVNAASGFSGRLLDLQTNGTSQMVVQGDGNVGLGTNSPSALFHSVNTSAGAATVAAAIQNRSLTIGTEVRLALSPNTATITDQRYAYVGSINETGSTSVALTFGTGAGASPTERMRIKSDGTINFPNVAVYADNAAAKTGGLVDGDVYRTSSGDLKIVYT